MKAQYFTDTEQLKNITTEEIGKIENKIQAQNYEEALDVLEEIYLKNPLDLHLNLLLGEIHLYIHQYREALKYFVKAHHVNKTNHQALYGLGRIYYLKGKTKTALQYLQEAHKSAPQKVEICNDIGSIYHETGNYKKAEYYYKKAQKIDSDFILPVVNLSSLYTEKKEYQKGLAVIEDCLGPNGSDIELLFNQGVIYSLLKQYEQAVGAFTVIINKDPQNVNALYHRGYSYLNLGQLDQARADLRSALKIEPEAENIRALLALTYTVEGKVSDSIDVWREFIPILKSTPFKKDTIKVTNTIHPMRIMDSSDIQQDRNEPTDISIVIPVYNEEGSIIILYNKLNQVLENLEKQYEIIFVDDGSEDNSLNIISDLANKDKHIAVIKFRRNYGQTAAFAAGFRYAAGNVVITMDADLQNDPADIPRLLDKMSEGYDLVSGWRKNRKDKTLKRKIPSKIANRIVNKLIEGTGIRIHDFGCSLKAYKKGIVKNLKLYGEMHRFIPAYAAWLGIKVAEIPVKHHPRQFGKTKYGLERVWKVVLDMITLRFFTGFKTHPLLFFGKFATFAVSLGGLVSFILYLSGKIFQWGIDGQTFLIILLFSILGGLQFIIVGLLSEIIMRGFLEAKKNDEYLVEEVSK